MTAETDAVRAAKASRPEWADVQNYAAIVRELRDADTELTIILDFEEATQHLTAGQKNEHISTALHMSVIRYYQRLLTIIHTREALEYHPILVKRLLATQQEHTLNRARRTIAGSL